MASRVVTMLPWVSLCLLVGCREHAPPEGQSATPTAPVTGSAPTSPSASTSAHPRQVFVPTSASSPARSPSAYAKALGRGRVATTKKDYRSAIAAFGEALTAAPDDPRALAERGYAKLLSGDDDGANADLVRVSALSPTADVAAQIWFNLGLLAEKPGGDPESARLDFARANAIHPSAAAKDKLAGRSACPVQVERAPGSPTPRRYGNWLALYAVTGSDNGGGPSADEHKPTTNEEAATAVGGASTHLFSSMFEWHLVVVNGASIVSEDLGESWTNHCLGYDVPAEIVPSDPATPLHVTWSSSAPTHVVTCKDPKLADSCVDECRAMWWTRQDLFVDRTSGKPVLAISQDGPYDDASDKRLGESTVSIGDRGVVVANAACPDPIPWKSP